MTKRMLCNLIPVVCFFVLAINIAQAQTRFWSGGTGNWNNTANWSTTSGGPGGASVPTATDAVVFDANSFTAAGQTVTVTAGATCASMDWTGVTNTPTLSLTNPLAIVGTGATFADAMTVSGTGALNFTSTGNVTVNFGNTAKTFGNISFPATTARTITLNTPAAATLTMGVLTVSDNATILTNGLGNKMYGGTNFGTSTRFTPFTNAVMNGVNTFAFDARPVGFDAFINSTINGTLSTISTIAPLDFRNCIINSTFTHFGNIGFYGVTLSSAAVVTAGSGTLGIYSACNFGAGTEVRINGGAELLITSTGNTFNNSWTASGNANIDVRAGNTFGGAINIVAGGSANVGFSGAGGYTFNNGFNVGSGNSNITFSNSGTNNFQNVTLGAGTNWRFSTGGTSTVSGSFTTGGTCAAPVNLNSNTGSSQAIVNFGTFLGTTNVNVSNINNTGTTINILAGIGSNNTNIDLPSAGRTLYWVGNSGNWNSTTNWSTTSGGPANACPPTAIDNVVFDGNSFSISGHTVTVTSGALCNDMTWNTGADNPILNLANELTVNGSTLTLDNTMTVSGASRITLANTGNVNVTTGTGAKNITGGFNFTGTATRTITLATSTGNLTLGQLRVGDNSTFNITGTSAKAFANVTLGTVGGSWAGTYTIGTMSAAGTLTGGLSLPTTTFNGTSPSSLVGQYTFTGTTTLNADASVGFSGTGGVSFANVTLNNAITGSTTSLLLTPSATNTITGTLAVSATCGTVRLGSSSSGAAAILSLITNQTVDNLAVQDINRTGAGTFTVNNGVNGGNTTGIAFASPAAAARTLYWKGGSGNWSDPNRWSLSPTGTGPVGECPPTINDDVFFNANSGFTGASRTVTINQPAFCRSMDWTGAANSPRLAGAVAQTLTIAGNLTFINAIDVTFAGRVVFASSAAVTRNINMGTTTAVIFANVDFAGIGGGWQFTSPFRATGSVQLIAGNLNANGQNISAASFNANIGTQNRTFSPGNGSHTISGTGTVLDLQGTGFTLAAGTGGTINFTNAGAVTVETGTHTVQLPSFVFSGSDNIVIDTHNGTTRTVFGNISVNGTITRTFTVSGTSPKTYGDVTIDGNSNTITFDGSSSASPDDNVFNSLTLSDGRTGANLTVNGNNRFNAAVRINGGAGSANSVNFTGTNVFGSTFLAQLANNTGTELQFASAGGTNTTTFNGSATINGTNAVAEVAFTNAVTFGTGANLTIGNNTTTQFTGMGNNTFRNVTLGANNVFRLQNTGTIAFQNVTANASSTFSLQNTAGSTFASATVNSQTGSGVTWEFRGGQTANFSGNMTVNAVCGSRVTVQGFSGIAQVNLPTATVWNNDVVVTNINATGATITHHPAPGVVLPMTGNTNVVTVSNINRTLYWVRGTGTGTGNWNVAANWSTTSGGQPGACAPAASDDVVFDINSFSGGGQTVTVTSGAACRNMTWTDGQIPATTTLAVNNNIEVNGSLALARNLVASGTSWFQFATNASAANTVAARTINIPIGTTTALPQARFNSPGVTWTVNGPAAFNVTGETQLQAGTLNTNGIAVNTGRFNANVGSAARTLTLGNTALRITRNDSDNGGTSLDFRGTNFTFDTPGASSSVTLAASTGWQEFQTGEVNPGSPRTVSLLRTMPNLILQCQDVDIVTVGYNVTDGVVNRMTFRDITNTGGGQFYIVGGSPKTYGAITVANNLNTSGADQRRIVGSNAAAPNHNIFTGPVSFGTNGGFTFEGNNEFMGTFTAAQTIDADNALVFAGRNVFNGAVNITGANAARVNPTVVFGAAANAPTIFNANVDLRGTAVTYRFSDAVTLAVGRTLHFDQTTIGWFMGGNGDVMAGPESFPVPVSTAVHALNGTLDIGEQARVRFLNDANNTLNNVNMGDYSILEFTGIGPARTTTVTGTLTAIGDCARWRQISSSRVGTRARVSFNNAQSWNYVQVRDIENVGSATVTAANSTNVGNSNVNIVFPGFVATAKTLYWVGGHPDNQSGNIFWSNPQNWALNPNDINQRRFGTTCPPDELTDVVFDNRSFSTATNKTDVHGQTFGRNYIQIDKNGLRCRNMTWMSSVMNGAIFGGVLTDPDGRIIGDDDANNSLQVFGNMTIDRKVDVRFNSRITFMPTDNTVRFIDLNGNGNGSDPVTLRGPIEFNSPTAVYELRSDVIIDAPEKSVVDETMGITMYSGELRGLGRNITLNGNWAILGSSRYIHGGGGTVTFSGDGNISDVVADVQNIVAGNSPFYNLRINRPSAASPLDIVNNGVNNQGSWVVIRNKNYQVGATVFPNPSGGTSLQPEFNGVTVDNNLTITSGGLYDYGYQIIGNNTGTLQIDNGGVLSIGNALSGVWSGTANNNPLPSLFPKNYAAARIVLGVNSTVSYSANGHQDVSGAPSAYGNLYLRNDNTNSENGLATLTGSATRKRLLMGATAINGRLTVERSILFHDMGRTITVGGSSSLVLQTGATMVIGSGNQTVATTTGAGYDPTTNTTGTTTLSAAATAFPAFPQANIDIHQNSNVVYASSLPQDVRGNLNATVTNGQRYGNLVLVNPTVSSPSLVQKIIQNTGAVQVNNLIVHPNANFVDNGQQINGTNGSMFVMNFSMDELASPFNGQAPTSSTVITAPEPIRVDNGTNPVNAARTNNWGLRYEGFINIPSAGTYTFYTRSDDGSLLAVDGTIVVSNNFQQGATTRSGTITFPPGTYPRFVPFVVTYHQGNGGFELSAEWQGPGISQQRIPITALSTSASGPTGSIRRDYFEAPAGVNYDVNDANGATSASLPTKWFPDLGVQPIAQGLRVSGESRVVFGTGTTATAFPTNYQDDGLNFDLGTTVVYNAGVAQTVRGLDNTLGAGGNTPNTSGSAVNFTTANRVYANLVLTNPVATSPRLVPKTLSADATVREILTINPNNNLIDAGFQLIGVPGTTTAAPWNEKFIMRNATRATNPVTNSGQVGATGESRFTIGTATTATRFPSEDAIGTSSALGFRTGRSSRTDLLLEDGTTIVYNAGVAQRVEGFSVVPGTTNATYVNLMLTNPATSVTTLAVKTLQNRVITIRGNFTINPNNVFLDNNFQVTGTSGQRFNMFNAIRPVDPFDGVTSIGTIGESRYVAGSNGSSTTFPGGYRTGATLGTDSDINFETNTTFAYSGSSAAQNVQGLGGTGNTTYANLWLVNRTNSGAILLNKVLIGQGTTIRGTLTIGPNNNFVDNGFQINGVSGQRFNMLNTMLAPNPNSGTVATIGMAGESRLTLGTAASLTTFPGGYTTQNGTDINFELGTWVVYNSGLNQQVAGIFNSTATSNANYAHLSFVNSGSGTVTKALTSQARVRQNLTIGGVTAGTASGAGNLLDASASNHKIFLQGNWFTHIGNGFNARSGELELEGTVPQSITTRNTSGFASETGTQDFWNLRVNNIVAVPNDAVTFGSNVAVGGAMTFVRGLVRSADQPSYTTAPTTSLLIFRHNATVASASDQSYVKGAVRKVGQVASGVFFFPIGRGDGTAYRPSGISNMTSTTGAFLSQYYPINPNTAGFAIAYDNIQSVAQNSSQPLINVSAREFWMIERENSGGNAFVTLTWRNPQSGGVGVGSPTAVPLNYQGLRVARWNSLLGSQQWRNHGGTSFASHPSLGAVGNPDGAVTSQFNVTGNAGAVDNFSPFTLASEITFNPLPVILVNFRAEVVNRQVKLDWQTSTELNTSHFVVERSRDGQNFEPVTQVAAKGNSTNLQLYNALDAQPFNGVSYYRLRIVDNDGSYEFSQVRRVTIGVAGGLGDVTLFPNPTDGRNISLRLADPNAKVAMVHDLLGRQVAFRTAWNVDGDLEVTFAETLAQGTYVAVVMSADGKQTSRVRFVVQR